MKIKCVFTAHLRKISGIFAKIRMFFEDLVMKRAACAALALVPEDVPIDLGVIMAYKRDRKIGVIPRAHYRRAIRGTSSHPHRKSE